MSQAHPTRRGTESPVASWTRYESPLGPLTLTAGAQGINGLYFPGRGPVLLESARGAASFTEAIEQLGAYFAGGLRGFDLDLDLSGGSAFQRSVWTHLQEIPCGQTISYAELAHRIGRLDRIRAAAAAVGRTPIPIIVPCHRVLGSDGSLTGYLGGLQRKRALLDLEQRIIADEPLPHAVPYRQLNLL